MISLISGRIHHRDLSYLVIDTGGVGYKIFVTPETIEKSVGKESLSLWTHLAVRENALDLYGFIEKEDMEFFELLITVSGIGPRSAIGILSVTSVDVLRSAISTGDTSYLTKVSGVGKKSADKIVLELRDKLGKDDFADTAHLRGEADVVETLKALGYRGSEIRDALKSIPKDMVGTSQRVKEALRHLGK
jgi:holliday junction DNA helicase RuvA